MINNPGVAAELAKGRIVTYDAVTLTISRGRIIRFPGASGTGGIETPIVDSVRWTSAPRPLWIHGPDGSGPYLFQPLARASYRRGRVVQRVGREVAQVDMSVAGNLPITLSTACDSSGVLSGAFATSLMELCMLDLLDGAQVTIDQVILPNGELPSTPADAAGMYGVVSINPLRRFAGIVRQATPTADGVDLACCDPLILGGGSVPTGVFSPACRWTFGDGRCPVAWNLQSNGSGTHQEVSGASIVFGDFGNGNNIQLPSAVQFAANWGYLVPQSGPMMGMRFQLGSFWSAGDYVLGQFADRLPWSWSGSNIPDAVHIEYECSKLLDNPPLSAGNRPKACTGWNTAPTRLGMPASVYRFSGCPDMPQPETA